MAHEAAIPNLIDLDMDPAQWEEIELRIADLLSRMDFVTHSDIDELKETVKDLSFKINNKDGTLAQIERKVDTILDRTEEKKTALTFREKHKDRINQVVLALITLAGVIAAALLT